MSLPSPIYLLLTNPSWGKTPAYGDVLAGITGHWEFDPNEQHEGEALLPTLLERWSELDLPEAPLLAIVSALLARGANPQEALDQLSSFHAWATYSGTRQLLASACTRPLEEASLAGQLLAMTETHFTANDAMEEITPLLDKQQGWKTRLDGIPVAPWFALHACAEGNMTGWSTARHATSDNQVRKLRLIRQVALASKAISALSPPERFLLGAGMSMMSAYFRATNAEVDAGNAVDKVALKILDAGDEPAWVDRLNQINQSDEFPPGIKLRLGMATVLGLVSLTEDGNEAWDLVAAALPLLYRDGRFQGSTSTMGRLFNADHGLPPPQFWAALPVNDQNHEALLRILVGSFHHRRRPEHHAMSKEFLAALAGWAQGGDLSWVDIPSRCAQWEGYRYMEADMVRQLTTYQEVARAMRQGELLGQSTQDPQARRSRARL